MNLVKNNSISTQNMIVNVTGPSAPYTFEWRFAIDQPQPLSCLVNITKFEIILDNF